MRKAGRYSLALPKLINVSLLACVLLTSCISYPINKQLQPYSTAKVIDQSGLPIEGATVHLITSALPYGFEKSKETQITNSEGIAEFPEINEWRIESLMIHGSEHIYWNWCVVKGGYVTFYTQWRSSDNFNKEQTFRLRAGMNSDCPPLL